jgi:hypothetical protein
MLRVLVQILKQNGGKSERRDFRLYAKPIRAFLTENATQIDTMRRTTSSEGTRESEARRFIKAIADAVPGFARDYLLAQSASLSDPQQKIKELEEWLRKLIRTKLAEQTGKWWHQRVPEDVRQNAESRQERRESTPWMEPKRYPAEYYVNFGEYRKIMFRNDNWIDAFEPVFKDKEILGAWLRILEDIRNDLMHGRDLNDLQVELLGVGWKVLTGMGERLSKAAASRLSEAATASS